MAFYTLPVIQVTSMLLVQFAYTIFLLNFRVFKEYKEQVTEVLNEIITLVTLYFLQLFTGQFMSDNETNE